MRPKHVTRTGHGFEARLSQSVVRDLAPAAELYAVRDTEIPGFHLEVRPGGTRTFVYWYRTAGGRASTKHKLKLGRYGSVTVEQARRLAKDAAAAVHLAQQGSGTYPHEKKAAAAPRPAALTLDAFTAPGEGADAGAWTQFVAARKAGAKDVARLRAAFKELLQTPLAELTAWQIEKWRMARLKAVTPLTVNRELAVLRSALSKALEWGHIGAHPMLAVKQSKVENDRRVRFLEPAELVRLRATLAQREERIRAGRDSANAWRRARGRPLLTDLRACAFADHLRPMVEVSLNTGLRWGELVQLQWTDVDLKGRMLTVRAAAAKGGKSRWIPLNGPALAALEGWRTQSKETTVFPGRQQGELTNVKKSWAAVLAAAEIRDFRWHDMRHHFASSLVQAGVDLNVVRELLGHADLKMVLRYAHLSADGLRAAVARIQAPALAVVDEARHA